MRTATATAARSAAGIGGGDTREQRLHRPAGGSREEHAERDADRREHEAAPEDHADDVARLGAEGDPDADLPRALGHREREQPVDPDAREQERDGREGEKRPRLKTARRGVRPDDLGERLDVGDRNLRIGPRDDFPKGRQQRRRRDRGAHDEELRNEPAEVAVFLLPVGEVDLRLAFALQAAYPDVADDADDRCAPRRRT